MRRRVEFARALFIDKRFLVADEPFPSVDVQTRYELYDAFLKMRKSRPRTGIICTHDPLEAVILCDAIVAMRAVGRGLGHVNILQVPARFKEMNVREAAYADPFLSLLGTIIG